MKVLLIEDEKLAAERLIRLLEKQLTDIQLVDTIDTVKESIVFFRKPPELDLIFCDVQLADGICFDIFNEVEVKYPIIFTTAYDQYSIEAFKVNSVQYLLKPIAEESLSAALEKYSDFYESFDWNKLRKWLQGEDKKILVRSGVKMMARKASEIALFVVQNKIVYAQEMESGKSFMTDYTLEELESEILDARQFFRVNRSCIINQQAIEGIVPHSGQRYLVSLRSDNTFDPIVSREKVKEFKQWYLE